VLNATSARRGQRLLVGLASGVCLLTVAVFVAIHRGGDGQPSGQGFHKVGTFQHSTLWARLDTPAAPGRDAMVSLETTGGPLNGQCSTRTPALIGITLCDAQLTDGRREIVVATPPQTASASITIQGRRVPLKVFPRQGTDPSGYAVVGITGDDGDLPVTSIDYRDSHGRPVG
jgi:hypothetical protein